MIEQMDMQAKFLGSMLGTALGDAVGEMAFAGPGEAELRQEIERADLLTYTDDTTMAIGLAESIIEQGRIDVQHLGDTFKANFDREPWRGYAAGPPMIFSLVKRRGVTYVDAAKSLFGGLGSFGNGAAMRIAPVGLFFHDAPDLYDQVEMSASVTHTHPVGIDGAAVLARAVAEAVKLDPQQPFSFEAFSQDLVDFARTEAIRRKMALVRTLVMRRVPPSEAARRLGRSVAVHESMPFAVYCFLLHPQSFETCLFCAVLNGGDRDTLGAMACAVSGAYLGVEGIPQAWREKVENRQHIEELALGLARLKGP